MSASRPVLIMAGGTGGHVFPGLAVAEEFRARGVPVRWLGTPRGLENRVVPPAGIDLHRIHARGLRGKSRWSLLSAPFMLLRSVAEAGWLMLRLRPRAVLGMGGFVAGPGGLAAWLTRRPLYIHEQNAVAGATNRLLAPLARVPMEAFPGSLSARWRPMHTGNPVRREIAALPPPEVRFAGRTGPVRLLVFGGSLGAAALNEAVPAALAELPAEQRPEVRHQTGRDQLEAARVAYAAAGVRAELVPFIEDMAAAYAWADLVVCRAGALTVAELAAAGVGAVLVPYPHAVDDHQTANARYLVDAGAAELLPQRELTPQRLAERLSALIGNRQRLLEMARAARDRAMPDAAARVAEICLSGEGVS